MKQLYLAFFITIILAFGLTTAHSEKRIALIIGNSAYQNVAELQNPKNDAVAMSKKLTSLGFEVIKGVDLDHANMRRTVRQFINKLDGADLALFFYAGHGLQVDGNNYMAPIDASLRNHNDLDFETIPMNLVLSAMERNAKTNIIFLDACRDNPLAENLARSMGTRSTAVGRGLARIGSGIGTFVSFSTQPGNVALDGSGVNSPYTTALIEHLGTPGEDLTRNMIKVRRAVLKATGGKQVPWEHSSLTGEVLLKEKPKPTTKPVAKIVPPRKPATASKPDNTVELTFWNSIKDSNVGYFKVYLEQYPNGLFANIARLRISEAKERIAREATKKANTIRLPESPRTSDTKSNPTKLASLDPSPEDSAINAEPTKETTRSVQRELNRLGCSAGPADGIWGKGSQRALRQYDRYSKVKLASLEPSTTLLDQLKAKPVRICPLTCRSGFEVKKNKCVRTQRKANKKKVQPARQLETKKAPAKPKKKVARAKGPKKLRCVGIGRAVGHVRYMTRRQITMDMHSVYFRCETK